MSEEFVVLVERVGPFLIPFVLYFGYLWMTRVWPPGPWRNHPWMLLTMAGLVLVALSFVLWRVTSVEPTKGLYVAPHMVNGKVVPGYVEPSPEKSH